jgi:hypothetical protein
MPKLCFSREGVVALLLADQHHRLVPEPRRTADDRLVVAEAAVAAERNELAEQMALILEKMRAERMAGNLRLLPGRQRGIEIGEALGRLALELADLLVDRHCRIDFGQTRSSAIFPSSSATWLSNSR